ncbi:MAG: biotin/lipoyl-containing protein [Planctomycetota bacterium]
MYAKTPKVIRVMFTPFRDGLQSAFGGKVRVKDLIPAMQASKDAGVRHFEFGGGARFQAPILYVNEDPFWCMDEMRKAIGDDCITQILTRSISGVTLTTQSIEVLDLQAKMMKKHETDWDRNFDFTNNVDLLIKTGRPIVKAGMHHQVCVALMGLPPSFGETTVHTPEYYIDVARQLIEGDVQIDSLCMKDASGTCDAKTVYETAKGIRAILPPDVPLWCHTHDTASTAVAYYMAAIEGGCDGIDLGLVPYASGTCQPDVRSMDHMLKGTGYSLDIDVSKMGEVSNILQEGMKDYKFNPICTTPDPRVTGFPMPGGAIGPNVQMMVDAGIADKYSDVLAEFPIVVKAGGAWTSVTPGSQFYWLQAFNNVMFGRWEKINEGYGRTVLGYFGTPPAPPDPKVVKIAADQLGMPPFDGDPLAKAPNNIPEAEKILRDNGLKVTDENVFLVVSQMKPGKKVEANEGLHLLKGKGRIVLPLKEKEKPAGAPAPAAAAAVPATQPTGPVACSVVDENGQVRKFKVTLEYGTSSAAPAPAATAPAASSSGELTQVKAPFPGAVALKDVLVKVGDAVKTGQPLAIVEAMKADHDVKSPCDGTIQAVHITIGSEVPAGRPIMSIAK